MDTQLKEILTKYLIKASCNSHSKVVYPEDLIDKQVIINSFYIKKELGLVTRYNEKDNSCWIHLDKAIRTKSGRKTRWYRCKINNYKEYLSSKEDGQQMELLWQQNK